MSGSSGYGKAVSWLNHPVIIKGSKRQQAKLVIVWNSCWISPKCHRISSSAHRLPCVFRMARRWLLLMTDSRVAASWSAVRGLGPKLNLNWSYVILQRWFPPAVYHCGPRLPRLECRPQGHQGADCRVIGLVNMAECLLQQRWWEPRGKAKWQMGWQTLLHQQRLGTSQDAQHQLPQGWALDTAVRQAQNWCRPLDLWGWNTYGPRLLGAGVLTLSNVTSRAIWKGVARNSWSHHGKTHSRSGLQSAQG